VDKAMIHAAAERQLDDPRAWQTEDLPPSLLPLVEERARRVERTHEFLDLLGWLDENGVSRSTRLELLSAPRTHWELDTWAAAVVPMVSRAADWQEDGPRIVRALVSRRAWFQVHSLWHKLGIALKSVVQADSDEGRATAAANTVEVTRSAHAAFAGALMDHAEAAARSGDGARLLGMLDAVSRLHHGSAVAQRLADLSRSPDLPEQARGWPARARDP
jgi:hypothetical protein